MYRDWFSVRSNVNNCEDCRSNSSSERRRRRAGYGYPYWSIEEWKLDYVRRDIGAVVAAAGDDVIVKVILETCLLTDEEIQEACLVSRDAGADYVKTSTGFSTGGATVEAVSLMKRTVGSDMKVKASGGIHTLEDARKMFYAGADRIGSSSGVAIAEAEMSEIHTI